ncbi:hypothetical protein EMEDMD4_440193 [Sinorhizobium medicae]|uniref:Uncharacterized protein n=1 Tax=Sinorhizobium medicae TaxID=110321 RepID=A0A508WZF9_9HYPH|nr:hypothetical protein EMEDMD4_440193 [Sinorhizobium medicae]
MLGPPPISGQTHGDPVFDAGLPFLGGAVISPRPNGPAGHAVAVLNAGNGLRLPVSHIKNNGVAKCPR